MNEYLPLPPVGKLKQQAKRLRTQGDGNVSHSQSLELLAHQMGFKDWNTLHALAGNSSSGPPITLGDRVSGRYIGQAFEGTVLGITALRDNGRYRVTLDFDHAVDVVKFDGFSCLRKRVTSVIDAGGSSPRRTTKDGPVLQLDLN